MLGCLLGVGLAGKSSVLVAARARQGSSARSQVSCPDRGAPRAVGRRRLGPDVGRSRGAPGPWTRGGLSLIAVPMVQRLCAPSSLGWRRGQEGGQCRRLELDARAAQAGQGEQGAGPAQIAIHPRCYRGLRQPGRRAVQPGAAHSGDDERAPRGDPGDVAGSDLLAPAGDVQVGGAVGSGLAVSGLRACPVREGCGPRRSRPHRWPQSGP